MMPELRLRSVPILLCLILLAAALPCTAQQGEEEAESPGKRTLRLDPFLAFEFGPLLNLTRTPGSWVWCSQCSGNGISYNNLARFGASLGITEFPFGGLETQARISLGFAGGEFDSDPYQEPYIDPQSNEVTQMLRQFNVSALTATLGFDLLFGGELVGNWQLHAGPTAEYRIFSHFVHTEQIIDPLGATFVETGLSTRIVAEGDWLASSPLALGFMAAISSPISFSDNLTVVPSLYTRLNGPAFTEGLGLRSLSGGLGISFQLAEPELREEVLPPSLPDLLSPVPPPDPPAPTFSASVNLYCLDRTGTPSEEGHLIPQTTFIRRHTLPEGETIVHDFYIPQIGVSPEIVADAGVKWWGLSIRQGTEEIARATSDAPEESLDLNIQVERGKQPVPLTAELLVEDSTGAITGARDHLSFFVDSTSGMRENGEERSFVEDWWILLEPDGTFDDLISRNRAYLEDIVAAAHPKGSATVDDVEIVLFPASLASASATAPAPTASEEHLRQLARHLQKRGLTPLLSLIPPDILTDRNPTGEETGAACLVVVRQRTSLRYAK